MPKTPKITKKRDRKIWKVDELHVSASSDGGKDITWDWNGKSFAIWFPLKHSPLVDKNGKDTNGSEETYSFTATLKKGLEIGDVYPYSIFCYDEKEMAEGGSGPEMIIDA
jgi:hypothetical protein